MSGNLAKVREKSWKRPKVRESSGNLWVREIWLWQLNRMLVTKLFIGHHITYLYFICTVICFSYVMFSFGYEMCICSTYCLQFRLEKSGIFFCLETGNPVVGLRYRCRLCIGGIQLAMKFRRKGLELCWTVAADTLSEDSLSGSLMCSIFDQSFSSQLQSRTVQ